MDNPETLAKSGTQDTGRRQVKYKNTMQHRKQSRMDNPEKLAKSGTQDTGRRPAKHKNTIQHRKHSRMVHIFYSSNLISNLPCCS